MPDAHLRNMIFLSVLFALLCALFSASLYSTQYASESKLKKLAEKGNTSAARLLFILDNPGAFTRGALFCIYLFSASACALVMYAGGSMAGAYFARLFPSAAANLIYYICAALIGFLAVCVLFIFSHLFPRYIAEHNPAGAFAASAWVTRLFQIIFYPTAAIADILSRAVLRLFKITSDGSYDEVTEDEILEMIDIGEESGAIETTEREMLENVFEFSNTSAFDVMTHRTDMEAIRLNDSDDEILELIKGTGFSRFPVYEDDIDSIIGVLTAREYLLNHAQSEPKPLSSLVRDALFVPEQVRADVLFREMQQSKTHLAMVLDEYGGTSGLVTMEDLLEEIFGNIYDEFDAGEGADIVRLDENLWRASGSIDLETLAKALDIEFNEEECEEFDTLGGLIFSRLSVIPDDGECPQVSAHGLDIRVERLSDRRVESALISKMTIDEEG